MDIMTTLVFETAMRSTIKTCVEHYVKGTCKVWFDRKNNCIEVSIIDARDRVFRYEEHGLVEQLCDGLDAYHIGKNAVRAFEQKIFHEFMK